MQKPSLVLVICILLCSLSYTLIFFRPFRTNEWSHCSMGSNSIWSRKKNICYLKFWLSEKHTKFEKIFLMVLTNQLIYLVNVKNMRKIFSNYVCFSKSPNFMCSTIYVLILFIPIHKYSHLSTWVLYTYVSIVTM